MYWQCGSSIGMPIVGMSIGGSPVPSHVGEVAGLHSAPTPPQNDAAPDARLHRLDALRR